MARPKKINQAAAGETALRARQRQKLIDSCITALHLHGPSRTTIDKVVAIADMSPGIVNFYFETKAALLLAALEHLAVEFEERVMAPLEALRADSVHALEKLVELYLDPDIASPRKVSVWYAFWGEASSRSEYQNICGKRDLAFADLVRDLMARLIAQFGPPYLDADAVALGLIGALEMTWQDIAFQEEAEFDRVAAQRRCMAYLRAIFPGPFAVPVGGSSPETAFPAARARTAIGGQGDSGPRSPGLFDAPNNGAINLLVGAELTLAGLQVQVLPPHWSGCGIIAYRPPGELQKILVIPPIIGPGGAASLADSATAEFDFLAILLPAADRRWRCFIVPRARLLEALEAGSNATARAATPLTAADIAALFAKFENNFALRDDAGGRL